MTIYNNVIYVSVKPQTYYTKTRIEKVYWDKKFPIEVRQQFQTK